MTKRKPIIALALTLGTLGAAAQSVTVVLNDGTQHKFGADYVKEISFQEASQGDEVVFKELAVDPYGSGNVLLTFKTEDGSKLECDTYCPADATYLHTGDYTVIPGAAPFTVDPGDYSSFEKDGVKTALASGVLKVAETDGIYTLEVEIGLADGGEVKGTWSGRLPDYSKYLEYTLSAASYNDNPRDPGEFYVKFNDANWRVEMALDMFGNPSDTVLAPGSYVYSADGGEMTFGPKSYVDIFVNPSSSNRMSGGVVNVSTDDNGYVIDMSLVFEDGRIATVSYKGDISGTPVFNSPAKTSPLMRPAAGLRTIRLK